MKQFIKNTTTFFLLALIPLVLLTVGYLYYDPFQVLRSYRDYSNQYVISNRDYISTETFINNNDKQNYNSFIFGSSRTLGFKPSSWVKYLPKGAQPFSFDASGESIYGIYKKIKFLDSLHIKPENALIILCRDDAFAHDGNHEGHIFIKDPKTSGESALRFQLKFYKAYFNIKFLFCFYAYTFTRHYHPYMNGFIEKRKVAYDTITNGIILTDLNKELMQNTDRYYTTRADIFYERTGERKDSISRISKKHLYMLTEVKRILEKNKTNYKVVLSPLYEQIKFNDADLSLLKTLFGNRLYDFSGKNSFTDVKSNYYETNHFRPNVGDSIFQIIYKWSVPQNDLKKEVQ